MWQLKANRMHPRNKLTHRQASGTDNDSSLLFTVKRQTVQTGELGHTNGQADGRTLPSALSPCFAVDNDWGDIQKQSIQPNRTMYVT